jgi:pimeloyl-ACP methyl ester carboxylesterase
MSRRRRRRVAVILIATLTVLGVAAPSPAAGSPAGSPAGRRPPPGPIDLTGELHGAPFEIRVPADWNGTLVAYAHGYRDKADHPGEVDTRTADAFIAAPFEEPLLDAGYALAGSAYRDNGWAVKEGLADTERLVRHFSREIARPDTTILVGLSMGSVIAFEAIETSPRVYDGAIPSCPVGAGAPRAFDGTLDISAAYGAVFGWPASWGAPGDIRDDIDFDTEVLPVVVAQLTAPGGAARFEFIRRAIGASSGPEWPIIDLYFVTEGRSELERRAGGPVVQNLDHTYDLTAADRAALVAMGLTDEQIDGWLAALDAERFRGPRAARRYVERFADYTGRLRKPVLTLHTVVDALVPPAHISAYNATVAAAGREQFVVNAWTSGQGHCAFTPPQMLTAVNAMQTWIDSGVAPGPADFPAAQGFVDFTPPPWPQP